MIANLFLVKFFNLKGRKDHCPQINLELRSYIFKVECFQLEVKDVYYFNVSNQLKKIIQLLRWSIEFVFI